MRLYKYIQKDILQENLQYQDLVEYNTGSAGHPVYPSKKSIIRNYLDAMDFYVPNDDSYECRYRILTKIINKYYNYELFTDNYEYFGNRMLWRLNKIMPTYRAKFNSLLAQNGYDSIWEDGLLWEHREGTRDTARPEKDENNHPVNFDRTDLADTTTTVGYNSDYPQVIVGSSTDYNATGDKTTTGRTGNDTVTHAMQENVGYGEDITRKFSPEEIAKAKLLFAQLIFNIDEEIVNAVADLFVLVDYPFEDDFDVAIQMSILDDAKAYTNLKFNESKAYTDQEVAKAKEIVYIPYDSSTPHSEIYDAIVDAVSNGKLPILKDIYNNKLWYLMDFTSGVYEFANGIDWVSYDYSTTTTGSYGKNAVVPFALAGVTFSAIYLTYYTNHQLPVIVDTDNNVYYPMDMDTSSSPTMFRFACIDKTSSYSILKFLFVNSNSTVATDSQKLQSVLVSGTSIKTINGNHILGGGNLETTVFYDIDDVTWQNIVDARTNHQTIILFTDLGDAYQYWYLDNYTENVNNDGSARFYFICGNRTVTIDYQNNQTFGNIVEDELFCCIYGTTTYAEITQALSDGKIPYAKYNNRIYVFSQLEGTTYWFTTALGGTIFRLACQISNNWYAVNVNVQSLSYRVSSWQATPDDAHYPTEKLVKDSIDAIPKLYKCSYGTTTSTEISQALNDGKLPYCNRNNRNYYYQATTTTLHHFVSVAQNASTIYAINCNISTSVWSEATTSYILTSQRVQSLSSDSTTSQVPSAKCVYDAIQGIIAGQTTATFLIDLSQQSYASGLWTISGVDLTPYSSFTILPYEKENPNWTSFLADNMYIDSSSITASGFQMYSGNSFQGKLRIVAYI